MCEVYDRDAWKHWIDADGDCQNARHEVLNATNQLGSSTNCTISTGKWVDPYTGNEYTLASDMDIDHMVPLAEAHESGGYLWDAATKEAYANDLSYPEHLRIMKDSENQSKGKGDPAEWLPDSSRYWKQYVLDWIKVKIHWRLTADSAELAKIKEVLGADTTLVEEFPVEAPETWCTGLDAGGASSSYTAIESSKCCKYCTEGVSQPCGDACISADYTCSKPVGCACLAD